MGITDYQLSGGIDSRVEEILATGLNATPESIQGLIEELKNRKYQSDLEFFLGWLKIDVLEQRLNSQGTSEVIMGYQEDLRNAISAIQSRLDELDAGEQSDLNEIQSALNTLQTTVNNLSTTVQGKANTTDIVDPRWGQIEGDLADQTDLTRALSGKASVSDLAAIDTRTRTLESTMPTKANQTDVDAALDAKANTVDVNAALDLKADTSYVTQMLATKADQNALDAKANISDVELMFSQLIPVINGKEDTTSVNSKLDLKANKPRVFSATVNKDDWSTSYPYTYNVSLPTVTSSENYEIYLILASNLTEEQVTKQQNSFSYIWYGETSENKVTLYARKKPEVTLNISLRQVV